MPALNPIQTSFAQGVISPRMRGNVGSKPYARGLARCENWIPTPQGSLLKANGYRVVAGSPGGAVDPILRILSFKSTNLERFQIALSDTLLQVFTPAGVFAAFTSELVVNGECGPGGGGWVIDDVSGSIRYAGIPGDYYLRFVANFGAADSVMQSMAAVPAGSYTLSFRLREMSGPDTRMHVKVGTSAGGGELLDVTVSANSTFTYPITVAAPSTVWIKFDNEGAAPNNVAGVADVSLRTAGGTSVATPWSEVDIANLQYVGETGRDRMVFVDGKHIPYVLSRLADGTWTFLDIATVGWTPDASWTGTNYPSVVDVWQGRLWFAATPAKKNTFWASNPGTYDFTIGDTAGDAFSYDVAMRGEIRWMQGQKVMLVGTDDGEYAISANDGVVYAGNINITQESAFGSAKLQAVPIGDEVLYVSPDRRKVRALKFSLEGGGWYSRDITFAAEHITKPGIVDLAFARDPFSTIVAVLGDGTLACCNYDRAEEVNGWWTRTPTEALLTSVSVLNTASGDEVWAVADLQMASPVNGPIHIVRVPLYETETPELDSALGPLAARVIYSAGTATYNSAFHKVFTSGAMFNFLGGKFRIEGTTFEVTAVTDPFEATVTVVSGPDADIAATVDWEWLSWHIDLTDGRASPVYPFSVSLSLATVVTVVNTVTNDVFQVLMTSSSVMVLPDGVQEEGPFVVGRPFTATAETLPLEGGNPAGTAQGFKVHYPDITARISDSVPPLINGRRAGEGRPFATPLDVVEERITADVSVKTIGLSVGGIITISQDLPFRTEVCAIYGQAQINKV